MTNPLLTILIYLDLPFFASLFFILHFSKSIYSIFPKLDPIIKYQQFLNVNIALTSNRDGVLLAIVLITSLMENSHRCIYRIFFISENPRDTEYQKVKSLEKRYNRLHIFFVDPPRNFEFMKKDKRKPFSSPIVTFYRLEFPNILRNLDRVIYIDLDCLIFDDLDEMFSINMDNFNIYGVLDIEPSLNDHIFNNTRYINAGVLVMNLKRMREKKITKKYAEFIKKNYSLLNKADQTIINNVEWWENGVLPVKYGIEIFWNIGAVQLYKTFREKLYSMEELKKAFENPVIAHLVNKPFRKYCKRKFCDLWWKYAMMTNYSEEYKKRFKVYYKYLNYSEYFKNISKS